jgi:hypothetical protein
MKAGDLAYLPSEVTLVKYDETGKVVSEWVNLTEPAIVLVTLPVRDISCSGVPLTGVHYRGSSWLAKTEDCREMKVEDNVPSKGI